MMNLPDRREAVFVFDPTEHALTGDNRLYDSGPHGLHATPVNYVAPAWGIATGPSGARYIGFNGATQRWTLPLDFYRYVPTTGITVVAAIRCPTPAISDRVFDCTGGAGNGFRLNVDPVAAERIRLTAFSGATGCYVTATNNIPLTDRVRVIVASVRASSTMASGRAIWINGQQIAVTSANTAATITYDATVVPTIGAIVGGAGNFFDDRLYHLSAWPSAWSHSQAVDMTGLLRDRE